MQPFAKLIGHDKSVEDVIFRPDSDHELCSVGVDRKILFWDTRAKGQNSSQSGHAPNEIPTVSSLRQQKIQEHGPVNKLLNVHMDDINTVDWSRINLNLIATGSNNKKVCVIDIRKLSTHSLDVASLTLPEQNSLSPVINTFEGHTEPILSVRFCPFDGRFLLSSAESVKIWDM